MDIVYEGRQGGLAGEVVVLGGERRGREGVLPGLLGPITEAGEWVGLCLGEDGERGGVFVTRMSAELGLLLSEDTLLLKSLLISLSTKLSELLVAGFVGVFGLVVSVSGLNKFVLSFLMSSSPILRGVRGLFPLLYPRLRLLESELLLALPPLPTPLPLPLPVLLLLPAPPPPPPPLLLPLLLPLLPVVFPPLPPKVPLPPLLPLFRSSL